MRHFEGVVVRHIFTSYVPNTKRLFKDLFSNTCVIKFIAGSLNIFMRKRIENFKYTQLLESFCTIFNFII